MKIRIISFCILAMMSVAQSFGGVTLSVPEVSIVPGTTSYVVINFDLGSKAYTAYQFDIAYPEGISSVNADNGKPKFIKGDIYKSDDGGHNVSSGYAPDGKARFQCFSIDSEPFTAQSGTLLILYIEAAKSLAEGTYQAVISPIEFAQTDATPDRPDAVTFNIKVTDTVILDENSTLPPAEAKSDVKVKVCRNIKANEWSTLCLPFDMTEGQVKEIFGNDVQLAYFAGYDVKKNGTTVTSITFNFEDDDLSEGFSGNYPYVIKSSKDITEFTLTTKITSGEVLESYSSGKGTNKKEGKFIGTYQANTIVPNNSLFLSGNKFWYSTGLTKMKAFRAYFTINDVLTNKGESEARIMMSFNNETTDVKTIDNSQLPIHNDVYDLKGRRIENPTKGLYIRNGRKEVVK